MADNQILDIILGEIRSLKDSVSEANRTFQDHAIDTERRLTQVESNLRPLLPNGQPGKIHEMSTDIESLKGYWKWCIGAGAAISAIIPVLIHFFIGG